MKIKWIVTGKTDEPCIADLIQHYLQRIERMIKLEYLEINAIRHTKHMSVELRKEKEGLLQLKHIRPDDYLILLDEKGKEYTSQLWAAHLEKLALRIPGNICFLTGGAYGFSEAVYRRAQEKLALSRMTFTHQIVRILFAEQLYRAISIIRGLPYHHE